MYLTDTTQHSDTTPCIHNVQWPDSVTWFKVKQETKTAENIKHKVGGGGGDLALRNNGGTVYPTLTLTQTTVTGVCKVTPIRSQTLLAKKEMIRIIR